ncbi:helicase senataxin [Biomphalaria pfeifferi]|uniref:Helicase senataxin n=1 Tax=Biomphalaria pfeifferi TaxID=112525 RepID=A0AAD8BFA1_BIOPF|nr:helicase senataxin [Biomphalaria pfeifferi]
MDPYIIDSDASTIPETESDGDNDCDDEVTHAAVSTSDNYDTITISSDEENASQSIFQTQRSEATQSRDTEKFQSGVRNLWEELSKDETKMKLKMFIKRVCENRREKCINSQAEQTKSEQDKNLSTSSLSSEEDRINGSFQASRSPVFRSGSTTSRLSLRKSLRKTEGRAEVQYAKSEANDIMVLSPTSLEPVTDKYKTSSSSLADDVSTAIIMNEQNEPNLFRSHAPYEKSSLTTANISMPSLNIMQDLSRLLEDTRDNPPDLTYYSKSFDLDIASNDQRSTVQCKASCSSSLLSSQMFTCIEMLSSDEDLDNSHSTKPNQTFQTSTPNVIKTKSDLVQKDLKDELSMVSLHKSSTHHHKRRLFSKPSAGQESVEKIINPNKAANVAQTIQNPLNTDINDLISQKQARQECSNENVVVNQQVIVISDNIQTDLAAYKEEQDQEDQINNEVKYSMVDNVVHVFDSDDEELFLTQSVFDSPCKRQSGPCDDDNGDESEDLFGDDTSHDSDEAESIFDLANRLDNSTEDPLNDNISFNVQTQVDYVLDAQQEQSLTQPDRNIYLQEILVDTQYDDFSNDVFFITNTNEDNSLSFKKNKTCNHDNFLQETQLNTPTDIDHSTLNETTTKNAITKKTELEQSAKRTISGDCFLESTQIDDALEERNVMTQNRAQIISDSSDSDIFLQQTQLENSTLEDDIFARTTQSDSSKPIAMEDSEDTMDPFDLATQVIDIKQESEFIQQTCRENISLNKNRHFFNSDTQIEEKMSAVSSSKNNAFTCDTQIDLPSTHHPSDDSRDMDNVSNQQHMSHREDEDVKCFSLLAADYMRSTKDFDIQGAYPKHCDSQRSIFDIETQIDHDKEDSHSQLCSESYTKTDRSSSVDFFTSTQVDSMPLTVELNSVTLAQKNSRPPKIKYDLMSPTQVDSRPQKIKDEFMSPTQIDLTEPTLEKDFLAPTQIDLTEPTLEKKDLTFPTVKKCKRLIMIPKPILSSEKDEDSSEESNLTKDAPNSLEKISNSTFNIQDLSNDLSDTKNKHRLDTLDIQGSSAGQLKKNAKGQDKLICSDSKDVTSIYNKNLTSHLNPVVYLEDCRASVNSLKRKSRTSALNKEVKKYKESSAKDSSNDRSLHRNFSHLSNKEKPCTRHKTVPMAGLGDCKIPDNLSQTKNTLTKKQKIENVHKDKISTVSKRLQDNSQIIIENVSTSLGGNSKSVSRSATTAYRESEKPLTHTVSLSHFGTNNKSHSISSWLNVNKEKHHSLRGAHRHLGSKSKHAKKRRNKALPNTSMDDVIRAAKQQKLNRELTHGKTARDRSSSMITNHVVDCEDVEMPCTQDILDQGLPILHDKLTVKKSKLNIESVESGGQSNANVKVKVSEACNIKNLDKKSTIVSPPVVTDKTLLTSGEIAIESHSVSSPELPTVPAPSVPAASKDFVKLNVARDRDAHSSSVSNVESVHLSTVSCVTSITTHTQSIMVSDVKQASITCQASTVAFVAVTDSAVPSSKATSLVPDLARNSRNVHGTTLTSCLKSRQILTTQHDGLMSKGILKQSNKAPDKKLKVNFRESQNKIHTFQLTSQASLINTIPSHPLSAVMPQSNPESFTMTLVKILKWNVDWLEAYDGASNSTGKCKTPPPLLGPDKQYQRLRLYYESLNEYLTITTHLLLLEVWETVYQDWKERKQNRPKTIKVHLTSMPYHTEQSENKKRCQYSPLVVNILGVIPYKERYQVPTSGDLLRLKAWGLRKGISTKDPNWHEQFALVKSVKPLWNQNKKWLVENYPIFEKESAFKNDDIHIFELTLNIDYKVIFSNVKLMDIEKISTLRTTERQLQALSMLPDNPLCSHLLQPQQSSVYFHQPVNPDAHLLQRMNSEQAQAISTIKSAVGQQEPKILFVQGPAGTGKTHTILALVHHILLITNFQGRICIATPSNAAVDEIARRIIQFSNKLKDNKMKEISLVRVGNKGFLHPQVAPYYWETLINNHLIKEKAKQVPEALKKENQIYKDKILKIERKLRNPSLTRVQKVKMQEELASLKKQIKTLEKEFTSDKKPSPRERYQAKCHVLDNAHVICGTLSSFGIESLKEILNRTEQHRHNSQTFTCLIIDEATQAIEVDTLIPLQYKVTKVVLVGDHKQLPATVKSQKANELELSRSLFERLNLCFEKFHENPSQSSPIMMLTRQYRMHPEILSLPNNLFYDGKLETDEVVYKRNSLLAPYLVFDIEEGQESTNSRSICNVPEAVCIARLCSLIMKTLKLKRETLCRCLGVICPYSEQKQAIVEQLRLSNLDGIEVNTVDGYQGQEKDVIIMSCVRAQSSPTTIGFISDKRRMNVALTRAKDAMYVLGHFDTLRVNDLWAELHEDARIRGLLVPIKDVKEFSCIAESKITLNSKKTF